MNSEIQLHLANKSKKINVREEGRRTESTQHKYEYNGDRGNNRISSIYRRFPDVLPSVLPLYAIHAAN